MRAMRFYETGSFDLDRPSLQLDTVPVPSPETGEILIRVEACGVCHTELDEIEGRTPPPVFPQTPGHQVIGEVIRQGPGSDQRLIGKRMGVAWIHSSCGQCSYCRAGRENLCPEFLACGRDVAGGYAQYMTVPDEFAHEIPDSLESLSATPLLCAGAVGYRALQRCRLSNGENLGLTGFGASGHLVLLMARHLYPDSKLFVFARNKGEREFAVELGAHWTGDTSERPPVALNAIIDTTPAWLPVICALDVLAPAGRLVINAIRKESADRQELLNLNYEHHLWLEKSVTSVANVTRQDVRNCLQLAADIQIKPSVEIYELEQANQALADLKAGRIRGAKALRIGS